MKNMKRFMALAVVASVAIYSAFGQATSGNIVGTVRIRAKYHGIAVSLGDKINSATQGRGAALAAVTAEA